jgi:dihydrofolate reductase
MSLDGYIARDDGDVSWLEDMNLNQDETGLEDFFSSIDGLVMGRKTYDFVFNYGSWPYEDKPTWVCTHSDLQPLEGANLIVVRSVDDVVSGAIKQGIEHLWLVGGGRLASSFLTKGLITNLSISEVPIRLGSGIPLFSDHKLDEFVSTKKNIIKKDGFRQIEVEISGNHDISRR